MGEEYYTKSVEEIEKEFKTGYSGIRLEEAQKRLQAYGFNELQEKKKINPFILFLQQFHSIVVYILLGAVLISLFLGEYLDGIVILVILFFNACFGFIQEYKAERSIEALKKLASLKAKVVRENKAKTIDARDLVPGDLVLLEEGDKVPADGRMRETVHIKMLESSLTGESEPVTKTLTPLKGSCALGDQTNMAFAGTVVTSGRGNMIVTATGMHRQIGKIAQLIEETNDKTTPLQKKLDTMGKVLGFGTIVICLIVFAAALLRGEEYLPAFLASVALAVAAIPEGLPAVVTISLALGVQRMIKKNALVRKLPSVETLGCTTVICTDKTGTLTKNQMTVRFLYVNGKTIEVSGSGYTPKGDFFSHGKKVDANAFSRLLIIGAINNNALLDGENVVGDPTEGCLLVSAAKAGLKKSSLEKDKPRIDEIVFDSKRKRMSTVHQDARGKTLFLSTKGAPDTIVHLCTKIEINGKVKKLTEEEKKKILTINHLFASRALRVLGFAYKEIDQKGEYTEQDEKDLIFVGLQAMIDPPREEVKSAIQRCREAGIRVIMITGDHGITAQAIGKELGIGTEVMTGTEIEQYPMLDDVIEKIHIFARVNPEHKLKIVEALQKKGDIVAMTGDGINDAPALKKADIGIAMGITGTDVSKEASDMVLTDDNFASIVNAVEEGRGIYGNIKKYFSFLLSGNISEVLIVFFITLLGFPLPLIATQILLINLVTDGFPALALGVDPFEPGTMKLKPRRKQEPLYKGLLPYLLVSPLLMMLVATGIFISVYTSEGNLMKAQTMIFVSIACFELFQAFACRSTIQSAFRVGIFKNRWLLCAVLLSFALLLSVVYIPALQPLFGTMGLPFIELMTLILLSSLGAVAVEITKWMQNRYMSKIENFE